MIQSMDLYMYSLFLFAALEGMAMAVRGICQHVGFFHKHYSQPADCHLARLLGISFLKTSMCLALVTFRISSTPDRSSRRWPVP